jgi:hypothetical protein
MRRSLLFTIGLGVLIAVTVAGVAAAGKSHVNMGKPVRVVSGNLELIAGGGFAPTTLSKTKPTPIALGVEGKINNVDGTHPPALKKVQVETDKNGAIDVKGFPVCKAGEIQATDTKHALAACGSALIGEGKTDIGILFEESKEVPVHSRLLVFNGGVAGGTTTLLIHAYITFPVPAAVVTTVKIKKIHHGPFGLLSIASIPKIAGGSGSVRSFSLVIEKTLHSKGKTFHILTLKCPTGRVPVHATATFADGTHLSAELLRTCTGRG